MIDTPFVPDLQASFACEDVRVEASGAHSIVGVLNGIGAPQLPLRVIKLCVWTRWCSGIGQFRQETRLICPDEATTLARANTEFSLENSETHVTNVNVFGGLEFQQEGAYHVEIHLDDELRLRYPLRVFKAKRPGQQQAVED